MNSRCSSFWETFCHLGVNDEEEDDDGDQEENGDDDEEEDDDNDDDINLAAGLLQRPLLILVVKFLQNKVNISSPGRQLIRQS